MTLICMLHSGERFLAIRSLSVIKLTLSSYLDLLDSILRQNGWTGSMIVSKDHHDMRSQVLRTDPRAHRLADRSKPWMPFPKAFVDVFVETLFQLKNILWSGILKYTLQCHWYREEFFDEHESDMRNVRMVNFCQPGKHFASSRQISPGEWGTGSLEQNHYGT